MFSEVDSKNSRLISLITWATLFFNGFTLFSLRSYGMTTNPYQNIQGRKGTMSLAVDDVLNIFINEGRLKIIGEKRADVFYQIDFIPMFSEPDTNFHSGRIDHDLLPFSDRTIFEQMELFFPSRIKIDEAQPSISIFQDSDDFDANAIVHVPSHVQLKVDLGFGRLQFRGLSAKGSKIKVTMGRLVFFNGSDSCYNATVGAGSLYTSVGKLKGTRLEYQNCLPDNGNEIDLVVDQGKLIVKE